MFSFGSSSCRPLFILASPSVFTVRNVTRHPTPKDLRTMSVAEQHDWLQSRRSRRTVLKGGLAGAGALLAAPVIGSSVASAQTRPAPRRTAPMFLRRFDTVPGASVQPFGRHIAFGQDPATEISVAWQVPVPVNKPFVRIGTDPTQLDLVVPAEIRSLATPASVITPLDSLPSNPAATIEQYYVHAAAAGLDPGTTYYYAVGHAGLDPATDPSQPVLSFTLEPRTAGIPAPFRFTAFGDQGVTYDAVATARLVGGQQPAFHLHAGDLSYAESGGSGLLTDSYDPRVFDSWFAQIEQTAGRIPWMAGVGNHEMEPWYPANGYGGQLARFDFLGNAPTSCPVSYTFSYGNIGFISLDANDVSYELEANLGYTGGAQTTWLGDVCAAYRADPAIDFIVAYFHQCAYCTCSVHASDGGIDRYWTPVFDTWGVDLVINGHNHIYERSDPIRGGSATSTAPIGSTISSAKAGTTYVTAGGAGKSLYSFPTGVPDSYYGNVNNDSAISTYQWELGSSPDNPTENPITVAWSRVRYTGYGLLVVDSMPAYAGKDSRLSVRALMEDGLTLIDEFSIVRKHGSSEEAKRP
jgi:hypothetical protein